MLDIGVYSELNQIPHLKNIQFLDRCVIHQEIESLLNSHNQHRIAALCIFSFDDARKQSIKHLIDSCDHVFIVWTEFNDSILNFIQQQDSTKVTYYVNGFLNSTLKQSKINQFLYWFDYATYFYRCWLPELLYRLKPFDLKTKSFDILLGNHKRSRDFVFAQANKTPEKYYLTYYRQGNRIDITDENWEQYGVKIHNTAPTRSDNVVEYYGFRMILAQIIPFTIYNQTAYSVVAESTHNNEFTLFSEKIVKPIMARRLFVVFAEKGYLANLKKLGFRTFGEIIDEDYDREDSDQIRWTKAWQQVEWLDQQPQEIVLEKIRPIVEHNFLIMMNTPWTEMFNQQLAQDFNQITDNLLFRC